jgi:prevent-host-death family protein
MNDNLLAKLNVPKSTDDCESDIREIINVSRTAAYSSVNVLLVQRNWLIGKRIFEEAMKGNDRAQYGANVILRLSRSLSLEFGKGFGKTSLYQFYTFYKMYPEIFQSATGKFPALLSKKRMKKLKSEKQNHTRKEYIIMYQILYNGIQRSSFMPSIISSAELRNNYAEVARRCHETGEPVFVTKNGKGDIAILSMEAYDRLVGVTKAREHVLLGLEQAEAGNTITAEEAMARARKRIDESL